MGLWQGATENTTVVKELLEDLVARGLDPERRYLFVIDGSDSVARGHRARVWPTRRSRQRCQIHKRRNVAEHLPKRAQGDYDRSNPQRLRDDRLCGGQSGVGENL